MADGERSVSNLGSPAPSHQRITSSDDPQSGDLQRKSSKRSASQLNGGKGTRSKRRRGCRCTLKDGCIAVAVVATLLGCWNIMGIYMCPSKINCKLSHWQREDYEAYPDSNANLPLAGGISSTPPLVIGTGEKERRAQLCYTMIEMYNISVKALLGVSTLAGILLVLAALQRVSWAAVASFVLFMVGIVLIVLQAVPTHFLAVVRFSDDIKARRLEDSFPGIRDGVVRPKVSLQAQKLLSVLGGIYFALLYLAFGVFALLFARYGLEDNKAKKENTAQLAAVF